VQAPGEQTVSILSDELSKPQYVGLTDQAAADAVNAKTVSVEQTVAIHKLKEYAILNGIWPKLKAGQANSNPVVAALCVSVLDWVDDPRISTLDVNKPEVQAMLDGLVSAGIMSSSNKADVVAMGSHTASWTSQNGLPEVGIGLVINARKEINAGA
jgi:hypothetical protein